MRIKTLLALVVGLLAIACSKVNDKYDPSLCQNFINEYSFEEAFHNDSKAYNSSLKNISQDDYASMIGQLKGIITQAYTEITNISVLQNNAEMKQAYEDFNDKPMLQQYKIVNGIVDDANSRDLLNDSNREAYMELAPIKENIAETDIEIKNRIR